MPAFCIWVPGSKSQIHPVSSFLLTYPGRQQWRLRDLGPWRPCGRPRLSTQCPLQLLQASGDWINRWELFAFQIYFLNNKNVFKSFDSSNCFITYLLKRKFYLFERQRVKERQTEKSSLCWLTLQKAATHAFVVHERDDWVATWLCDTRGICVICVPPNLAMTSAYYPSNGNYKGSNPVMPQTWGDKLFANLTGRGDDCTSKGEPG